MFASRSAHACAFVTLLVLALGVNLADAGMISIDMAASPSTVAVNDAMTVKISAKTDEDIAAFGFHLVFDQSLLALDDVAVATPFVPIEVPDAPAGYVAGFLPFGATQGPSPVLLATVTFTARAAGRPSVSIGMAADNGMEGFVGVPTDGDSGVTKIDATSTPLVLDLVAQGGGGGGNPAPEPMTVLFLLGGLLGVRPRRRAR